MQTVQGIEDKIDFGGSVQHKGRTFFLKASVPPSDVTIAKNVLMTLFDAVKCGWEIDIKDSVLTIWHQDNEMFAFRMPLSDVGKGMSKIKKVAREMNARIEAGAC